MGECKKVKLGQITQISSGGTPSRSNKEYYKDGTIPWIKTGDLKSKELYFASEFITELGLQNSSAKIFPRNTVLVAMYGATIGACSILKNPACTNQACAALLPNENINYDFLYYYILSKKEDLINLGVGGAQPNISATILKDIDIVVPPKDIQKKIVDLLDIASDLINLRKKQIEELDNLVQSVFYDMFGNPVINNYEWETQIMDKVAPSKQFKNIHKNNVWLLNLDMVESNTGRIIEYIRVKIDEIGSSTCSFNEENILYSKLRPYLNKVVIPFESGFATSELIPLKPNASFLNRFFLAYLLRSKSFVSYISEKTAGAKMPRVSMDNFRNFEVILPPIELQKKFASYVEKIEQQKSLLQKGLTQLELNYKSLMQRAFNGTLFE